MPFRLDGKTAVITGAGQGIGRASALLFAEAGATVWATDRNPATLEALQAEHPDLGTHVLDVRDSVAIQDFAHHVGTAHILFNCAGVVHAGSILDCSDEQWSLSLDINAGAMFRMCKAFLPAMLAAGGGSILNMASVVSSVKGAPNRFAYGASKAAVVGLSKSIAADFIGHGIRCNALCPGTTDTPSLHDRMSATGNAEQALAAFTSRQPMGRLGRPEEIAAAALYLASDESRFLTGQAFIIDGGMSL
jgi:2-keto-3-deoxy-L-fuconate dehydrogenase